MSGATWLPLIGAGSAGINQGVQVAGGPPVDHGQRCANLVVQVWQGRKGNRITGVTWAAGWPSCHCVMGSGAAVGLVCGRAYGMFAVHGQRCAFWVKCTGLRPGFKILFDSRAVGWRENGRAGMVRRRGKAGGGVVLAVFRYSTAERCPLRP